MSGHWPFWAGGLALAGLTVASARLLGRPLGVSSSWEAISHFRERREQEQLLESMLANRAGLEAALLEATRREMGGGEPESSPEGLEPPLEQALERPTPVTAHLVFLLMLAAGGAAGAISQGRWSLSLDLGPEIERLVAEGWKTPAALLLGGVLVGFGTRMAGGCTSGHGLSGCSRLQPASLLATAAFFGAAVVCSLALACGAR